SVAAFWRDVREARVTDPAVGGWELHEQLGVERESALVVVFEHPRSADTLYVGRVDAVGLGFFARLPGHEGAHHVRSGLRASVARKADAWRSLRVLALDTGAVGAVEISTPAG